MTTEEKKTDEMRIALAIPWCPWIPERVQSFGRLHAAILAPETPEGMHVNYREFTEKLPNDEWSEQVFEWLAEQAELQAADWCIQIQEDAVVPPNFWKAVRALLEGVPEDADVVGIHVCHPIAAALAKEGHRLFTTTDALVGVCWAVRGPAMREFVEWRRTKLVEGWRTPVPPKGLPGLTEDTMMALWAMTTGRRIYHPIPALVDHDTSMASVWGNDDHQNRRPRVSWKDAAKYRDEHGPWWDDEILEGAGFWKGRCRTAHRLAPDGSSLGRGVAICSDRSVLTGRARIPHVGRFYDASPFLALQWVEGFGQAELRKTTADTGEKEKRRLFHAHQSTVVNDSGKRIFIATPTRGQVDPQYATTLLRLSRIRDIDFDVEVTGQTIASQDLVRVRSRLVRQFLISDATHLLFLDADISCSPLTVMGMLHADRGFVGAPYPRRGVIDFDGMRQAIKEEDPRPLEAHAFDYAVKVLPGTTSFATDSKGCIEVASIPLGCAMLERSFVDRMVDHFGPELTFLDVSYEQGPIPYPTVALFQLMIRDQVLLSEDTSFCARVRDMGEKVWMYLGHGSPVAHTGEYTFDGRLDAFNVKRANP